jgi:outer membrane protein OmpA-like peptidoglycan-associated protein
MKILLIGFLALFGWSAVATHLFVCKIKGLCNDVKTIEISPLKLVANVPGDTLSNSLIKKQEVVPGKLLIYFEFDKSEFKSDSLTDRYFVDSDNYLDKNSQASLMITGYTDAVGSDEYNQALGNRRAQTMQHYFEKMGMPANKIVMESKGENEPADDNSTTSGRARNRRTVITIKN